MGSPHITICRCRKWPDSSRNTSAEQCWLANPPEPQQPHRVSHAAEPRLVSVSSSLCCCLSQYELLSCSAAGFSSRELFPTSTGIHLLSATSLSRLQASSRPTRRKPLSTTATSKTAKLRTLNLLQITAGLGRESGTLPWSIRQRPVRQPWSAWPRTCCKTSSCFGSQQQRPSHREWRAPRPTNPPPSANDGRPRHSRPLLVSNHSMCDGWRT
jgi:hypothetical protein